MIVVKVFVKIYQDYEKLSPKSVSYEDLLSKGGKIETNHKIKILGNHFDFTSIIKTLFKICVGNDLCSKATC